MNHSQDSIAKYVQIRSEIIRLEEWQINARALILTTEREIEHKQDVLKMYAQTAISIDDLIQTLKNLFEYSEFLDV